MPLKTSYGQQNFPFPNFCKFRTVAAVKHKIARSASASNSTGIPQHQLHNQNENAVHFPGNKCFLDSVKCERYVLCSSEFFGNHSTDGIGSFSLTKNAFVPDDGICLHRSDHNAFCSKSMNTKYAEKFPFSVEDNHGQNANLNVAKQIMFVADKCREPFFTPLVCFNTLKQSDLPSENCISSAKNCCARTVCCNASMGSCVLLPDHARNLCPLVRIFCCTSCVCSNASKKADSFLVRCSCTQGICGNATTKLGCSMDRAPKTLPSTPVHKGCARTRGPSLSQHKCTQHVCQNATMKNSLFFNYTKCITTTDPPINMNDEINCSSCSRKCSTKMLFLLLNWVSSCLLLLLNFGVLHHVWIGNFLFLSFNYCYLNVLMDLLVYFPSFA